MSINNIPPELLQIINGYNNSSSYKWIVHGHGRKSRLFQNLDNAIEYVKLLINCMEIFIDFIDNDGIMKSCAYINGNTCWKIEPNDAYDSSVIGKKLKEIGIGYCKIRAITITNHRSYCLTYI